MTGSGSDRRAHGLKATVRRGCYGLLLWCGQMAVAHATSPEPTSPPIRVRVEIEALPTVDDVGTYRVAARALDPRLPPRLQTFTEHLGLVLRDHVSISPLAQIGEGVGIDLCLPQAGSLHLLLSARNDDARGTPQWTLSESAAGAVSVPSLWSLGATLETIDLKPSALGARYQPELGGQTTRKVFAQQLRVDIDRLWGWHGDAVMTLQRSPWIDRDSGRRSAAIVQMHLAWRF